MTNEMVKHADDFLLNPQSLNSKTVRQYLDPQGKATDGELAYFIAQAKAQNLNPFTNEIYFIKYGNQPAQIVVALKAFQKKADTHPQFDGMDSGIIYEKDGEIQRSEGAFLPRGAEILGAWAVVYRKDRTHPTKAEVTFSEYDNSKIRKEGKINQYGKENKPNTWDEKPAVMIHKVALVTALRNAFPNELGGLYEADELREPKDVTPQERREEILERRLNEAKAQQAKLAEQGKLSETARTVDETSDPVEESVQGELLDGELEY